MNSLFFGTLTTSRARGNTPAAAPAWYDVFPQGSISSNVPVLGSSFSWGSLSSTIALPAGSLSSLRFNVVGFSSTTSVKIAVYNSSNSLIADASTSVTAAGNYEISISPVGISSDNYKSLIIGNGNSSDITWGSRAGDLRVNGDTTYASFPVGTYPTMDAYGGEELWWGAYVTPS